MQKIMRVIRITESTLHKGRSLGSNPKMAPRTHYYYTIGLLPEDLKYVGHSLEQVYACSILFF